MARSDEDYAINVIKSGFNRFYYEGYSLWSKENFDRMAKDINPDLLESAFLIEYLKKWEEEGCIQFIGLEDQYIKVIRPEEL